LEEGNYERGENGGNLGRGENKGSQKKKFTKKAGEKTKKNGKLDTQSPKNVLGDFRHHKRSWAGFGIRWGVSKTKKEGG